MLLLISGKSGTIFSSTAYSIKGQLLNEGDWIFQRKIFPRLSVEIQ
jgi:hypothetical protein